MKPSTRNKTEGKLREIKGKAKQTAGRILKDPDLEAEGAVEKVAGKVQKKVGDVEKVFGQ